MEVFRFHCSSVVLFLASFRSFALNNLNSWFLLIELTNGKVLSLAIPSSHIIFSGASCCHKVWWIHFHKLKFQSEALCTNPKSITHQLDINYILVNDSSDFRWKLWKSRFLKWEFVKSFSFVTRKYDLCCDNIASNRILNRDFGPNLIDMFHWKYGVFRSIYTLRPYLSNYHICHCSVCSSQEIYTFRKLCGCCLVRDSSN